MDDAVPPLRDPGADGPFAPQSDGFWPIWPLLGWGLGLAFHAWGVLGAGRSWEREYETLKARQGR